MSDPYSNLFGDETPKEEQTPVPREELFDDRFKPEAVVEPLDRLLEIVSDLKPRFEAFTALMSATRAVDHAREAASASSFWSLFIVQDGRLAKGFLEGEKKHHQTLQAKFRTIISDMKRLAILHLDFVKQFNADIDRGYYSIEKTAETVRYETDLVVNAVNLQRQILSEAARDLDILKNALIATENRMKKFVDFGGLNNLSASEWKIIRHNREYLSSGGEHVFNYSYLRMNVVDKTALQLGKYLKTTTVQYLIRLERALANQPSE